MKLVGEASTQRLRWACPPSLFPSDSQPDTREIGFPGQQKMADSLQFLLNGSNSQAHMYACGNSSLPKEEVLKQLLGHTSLNGYANRKDWVYVNGFTDSRRPQAICLEPGQGKQLQNLMNDFIVRLTEI